MNTPGGRTIKPWVQVWLMPSTWQASKLIKSDGVKQHNFLILFPRDMIGLNCSSEGNWEGAMVQGRGNSGLFTKNSAEGVGCFSKCRQSSVTLAQGKEWGLNTKSTQPSCVPCGFSTPPSTEPYWKKKEKKVSDKCSLLPPKASMSIHSHTRPFVFGMGDLLSACCKRSLSTDSYTIWCTVCWHSMFAARTSLSETDCSQI